MLILSQSDLRAALTMRESIKAVEAGFRALACGNVSAPHRLRLDVPARSGVLLEMPAHMLIAGQEQGKDQSSLGSKIVSVFERNAERKLEIIQSVYLLLDGDTGVPLALMDGRFLTALRTAATSALATSLMAAS